MTILKKNVENVKSNCNSVASDTEEELVDADENGTAVAADEEVIALVGIDDLGDEEVGDDALDQIKSLHDLESELTDGG